MRTRTPRLPTPLALVVLAGCVLYFDAREEDRPPPPPTANGTARVLFERDVFPILMEKCVSCHAATSPSALGFMDPDPAQAYDTIINTPDLVGDFTSAAAAPMIEPHAPVAYTADERAKIANWLAAEVEERQGTAAPTAPFADKQVREWSGCMSHDDFVATNMRATSFEALTESRDVLLTYFAVDISTGVTTPQIVLNPNLSADDPAMAALRSFYELTHARQVSQRCDAPRLRD